MYALTQRGILALLLVLLAVAWALFSVQWYVCGVKGFCAPAASAATCAPLITSDIVLGARNDAADVARLETFLDSFGERLPVNGVYGRDDQAAVMRFQEAYRADVLAPWGLNHPTGRVMDTTRAAINAIHCASGSSTYSYSH
jgi:hypothetical protein